MRVLGVELSQDSPVGATGHCLVLLQGDGGIERTEWVTSLPEIAATVGKLVGDDACLTSFRAQDDQVDVVGCN